MLDIVRFVTENPLLFLAGTVLFVIFATLNRKDAKAKCDRETDERNKLLAELRSYLPQGFVSIDSFTTHQLREHTQGFRDLLDTLERRRIQNREIARSPGFRKWLLACKADDEVAMRVEAALRAGPYDGVDDDLVPLVDQYMKTPIANWMDVEDK